MPLNLYSFQLDIVKKISCEISNGKQKIMLQLPTGAGKTICFVELVKSYWYRNERCLIIAHRQELIDQIIEKIRQQIGPNVKTGRPPSLGDGIGLIKGSEKKINEKILVASIQTLTRFNPEQILRLNVKLIVIDEAHHAASNSYKKVIDTLAGAVLIGVTATPCRTDKQGFRDIFDILIQGPSVKTLIGQNFLCNYSLFAYHQQKIDVSQAEIICGDYDLKYLASATNIVFADIVPTWLKHANGKQTVLFAVNIEQSKRYKNAFNDNSIFRSKGYKAVHLDWETDKEQRKTIINKFKKGEIKVLCNVSIISEGFDLADMECVQIIRPTISLGLWMQMVGRVLRYRDNKHAIILDHTDNYARLGLPDIDRKWMLHGYHNALLGSSEISFLSSWQRSLDENQNCELDLVHSSQEKTTRQQDSIGNSSPQSLLQQKLSATTSKHGSLVANLRSKIFWINTDTDPKQKINGSRYQEVKCKLFTGKIINAYQYKEGMIVVFENSCEAYITNQQFTKKNLHLLRFAHRGHYLSIIGSEIKIVRESISVTNKSLVKLRPRYRLIVKGIPTYEILFSKPSHQEVINQLSERFT